MQNPAKKDGNPGLLTAFQLHDTRLYIHGEILQIHRTRKSQGQSKLEKKKIRMNYRIPFFIYRKSYSTLEDRVKSRE